MKLFDWIAKVHCNIYKEEEPPKMAIVDPQRALLQAQANANAQLLQNAGYQGGSAGYYVSNAGSLGNSSTYTTTAGGYTPSWSTTGIGANPTTYGQYTTHLALPSPTGNIVQHFFIDSFGSRQTICIDQAYVALLDQISALCRYPTVATQPTPRPVMLDGDFSFDEMDQAEQLIQEMSGDKKEPSLQQA